jgi:aryl-alcohol dehydrogenase-like predicted oxidoreductase
LALAWCLQNPNVSTVITGASKPHQVEENMQAIDVGDQIDAETRERIEDILDNQPSPPPTYRK